MDKRELYRQRYAAELEELGAKIIVLKAHAQKMTAQARIDAEPRIAAVHEKVEIARSKIEHVAQATEETWDAMLKDADDAWTEAKSLLEGAFDALKGEQNHVEVAPAATAKPAVDKRLN